MYTYILQYTIFNQYHRSSFSFSPSVCCCCRCCSIQTVIWLLRSADSLCVYYTHWIRAAAAVVDAASSSLLLLIFFRSFDIACRRFYCCFLILPASTHFICVSVLNFSSSLTARFPFPISIYTGLFEYYFCLFVAFSI